MRRRIAYALCGSLFSIMGLAACAPIIFKQDRYAEICDDAKDPTCAPDKKVEVE